MRILPCARCPEPAIGRCTVSGQPYCRGHIDFHGQASVSKHPSRLFPLSLVRIRETCPECEGPVKVEDNGELLRCKNTLDCGWADVVEVAA